MQSFPRPPLLERTPRRIQIKWQGEVIADTQEAYWVLETHHAPSEETTSAIFLQTCIGPITNGMGNSQHTTYPRVRSGSPSPQPSGPLHASGKGSRRITPS